MSNITLDEFFSKRIRSKLDLGKSLVHFIAQDSVNKLENEPMVIDNGVDMLADIFDRSEFEVERALAGYHIAKGDN